MTDAPLFANLPPDRFNTIVVDPPWSIPLAGRRQGRHKRPRTLPYRTLTLDEIRAFPLGELAAPGAHVYCWTTNRTLPDAFQVLASWGVRYHLTLTLVKKSGIVPCNGYAFATEFCLLGFFGRPMLPFVGIGRLNWLQTAPVAGRHSVKPDEFYALVEAMSPGPRLDCFARRERLGWDSWGDELPDSTVAHYATVQANCGR